jgi:hypothetical protein
MSGAFHVETPADLARAIVLAEAQGSLGFVHLARALAAGRIAFDPISPTTSSSRFKAFTRLTKGRAAVISIGDDDGMDRGPGGWPIARRCVAWASSIMIHGAGAEIAHYEAAIVAAELKHRSLVIECGSATLSAWIELVANSPHRRPTIVIWPRGGVHPVWPGREAMQ